MEHSFENIVTNIAEFMAVSAKTAPKSGGNDFVGIKIITGQEMVELAEAMKEYGKETGKRNFDRDGDSVAKSMAVLPLSLEDSLPIGMNCGACGKQRCSELNTAHIDEFEGPLCAWRLLDLGIAIGSAVKTASMFNLDNRIMYRVGAVAKKMGLIEGQIVVGIPVSVSGKNIYFHRAK